MNEDLAIDEMDEAPPPPPPPARTFSIIKRGTRKILARFKAPTAAAAEAAFFKVNPGWPKGSVTAE